MTCHKIQSLLGRDKLCDSVSLTSTPDTLKMILSQNLQSKFFAKIICLPDVAPPISLHSIGVTNIPRLQRGFWVAIFIPSSLRHPLNEDSKSYVSEILSIRIFAEKHLSKSGKTKRLCITFAQIAISTSYPLILPVYRFKFDFVYSV